MKKRHHQIPQFYLRRFSEDGNGERIYTYDMRDDLFRSSKVSNTGVEGHLYSFVDQDGQINTQLEEAISGIEGVAAPILESYITGGKLTDQDRLILSSFFALSYVRTDSLRRSFAEAFAGVHQLTMHFIASHDKAFTSSVSKFEKEHGKMSQEDKKRLRDTMIDPSLFNIEIRKHSTLKTFEIHPDLTEIIYNMNWTLLRYENEHYFITSDNPLVNVAPFDRNNLMPNRGFLASNVEVTMPLTPNVCWLGHWDGDLPAECSIQREDVKQLNRIRAVFAERYLFGPHKDPGIRKLAKKYKDTKPTIQVGGPGADTRSEVLINRRLR